MRKRTIFTIVAAASLITTACWQQEVKNDNEDTNNDLANAPALSENTGGENVISQEMIDLASQVEDDEPIAP